MNALPPITTLDSLAGLPRFVVWRNEERNGNVTKVPYVPGENRRARADDPSTWRTRPEAEAAAELVVGHLGGGIGIELGDLDDGRAIGGIDFDTCRDAEGQIEHWATDLMQKIGSYAEVSPSGAGAKQFFLYVSVREQLESSESLVIPCGWSDSQEAARCGRTRTALDMTAASCAIRVI